MQQVGADIQPSSFPRVLIVGLGLLGGSFGLALQQARQAGSLWGQDRDPAHLAQALALGLVQQAWDAHAHPEPFDLVFLAVPAGQIAEALKHLGPWLRPDTLLLDACSVKGPVVETVRVALGDRCAFVPSHPIAGSHRSGPEAARGDLFQGATVVLTPPPGLAPEARERACALWQSLGAVIRELSPEAHDEALGLLSHLPQLLAFTYVNQAAQAGADLTLAGSGFRDFTRLAQSSPELWADVALANRAALLPLLQDLQRHLAALAGQLQAEDRAALTAAFQSAATFRATLAP